jgi:2'-5' RNA ligase
VGKRLFLAVDIDEATRSQIESIATVVRSRVEASTKASWVRPERMHVTLLFFGHADAALEERMRAALAAPVPEPGFDISFHGLGFFPDRGSPRVLWLGIREGAAALRRVHAALDARVAAGGPEWGDARPFAPHLTLARFRDRTSRAQLAEIAHIPAHAGPSRIDRVTLYESRLSPAGPTYLPLAEAPLRP